MELENENACLPLVQLMNISGMEDGGQACGMQEKMPSMPLHK